MCEHMVKLIVSICVLFPSVHVQVRRLNIESRCSNNCNESISFKNTNYLSQLFGPKSK
jgi:hypothetical protein